MFSPLDHLLQQRQIIYLRNKGPHFAGGGQRCSWMFNHFMKLSQCFCSFSASDLRQETRVLRRLGAQVLGFGHVKQDVHDVGGDVQGQGESAPPVPLDAVAEHLAPELRPAHEAVVCGT